MATNDAERVHDELRTAARQILGDIEAMVSGDGFGGFSDWNMTDNGECVVISWPNLEISAARLRKALEEAQ